VDSYDAVIAGGGPAGLSLAAPLAERGFRVLVVERNARIGLPVRTSGGSWPEDLRALGLPDRLWHPIHRLSFRSRRSHAVVDWGGPAGCALDVTATWEFLAEVAREAGAEIRTSTMARHVAPGRVALRQSDRVDEVACRLAVDATGTTSLLARGSDVHPGFTRVGVGYEQELSAPRFPQEEAMILVGGAVAPAGYAWAFPRGGTRVRAGVGVIQPDVPNSPREFYPALADLLSEELAGSETLEHHAGRIPSQEAPSRLTGDGVLVVGDAACQSNPLLGEGIRHVIRAARRAAPIAAEALGRRGVVPRERLRRWERIGRRERGASWGLAMRANRYVAQMDDDDWDRAVELIAGLPADVMTPLLRGDLLSPGFVAATARSGPRAAWRVARPFLAGRRPAAAGAA
jgi:digeranylgeranylglycerophospholipid reductase